MFAVISCLHRHDPRLVAWAAMICVVSVISGLTGYRQALMTRGAHRRVWIAVVALVLGSGVWATHFMAMLAFQREMKIGFGVDLTGASLAVVVVGMAIGVGFAATRPSLAGRLAGGAICGGAIAAMHFVGVAGMRLAAILVWDPVLVALAVAISIGGTAAAFAVAGRLNSVSAAIGATLLLVVAICGLHFTAMGAATLLPTAAPADLGAYGRSELAFGVIGLTALIVVAGGGMLGVDRISALTTLAGLRSALNCAPSAMAFFDGEERLMVWNQAYDDILHGHGLAAARGLPFRRVIVSAAARGLVGTATARTPSMSTLSKLPAIEPFADFSGRWFQPRFGVTADGGYVVLITDITEHLELSRRETEARMAAEAANAAKSEFLANMSHEIRTPLNAVLGMVQVMRRDALELAQRERLDVISDAGRALLSVLDGVLDLSKIEAGKLELETHTFQLAEVVAMAASAYEPLAAQKDVGFHVDIDAAALGAWRGDSAKLRQVLANLLSNALKFTTGGAIGLTITRTEAGLAFAVRDSGEGIAADKLPTIFDKFTQADASMTRRHGGSGLGLAICQRFVALMGGELRVESQLGAGSVFSFELRLERGPAATGTTTGGGEAERDGDAPPLRILAAEDNPTNQLILKALLEPFGVDLTMAGNGLEAVDAFAAARFDLVLMDAQMPEMNGIDATLAIRQRERAEGLARTPIIALTANVMSHQIEAYRAAGMDDVVAKPIELGALLAAIEAALAAGEVSVAA